MCPGLLRNSLDFRGRRTAPRRTHHDLTKSHLDTLVVPVNQMLILLCEGHKAVEQLSRGFLWMSYDCLAICLNVAELLCDRLSKSCTKFQPVTVSCRTIILALPAPSNDIYDFISNLAATDHRQGMYDKKS